MFRICSVLGLSFVALALIVGTGQTGGGKKETQPKKKVQLPPNFGKLGLSDEQKKKIYGIREDYVAKIDALQEKIEGLRKTEFADMMKVLSDDQRAQYRKIVTKDIPEETKKKSDGR